MWYLFFLLISLFNPIILNISNSWFLLTEQKLILCLYGSNVKLLHFNTVACVWYYYHHYDNKIVVISLCNIIVMVMVSTQMNLQKC